MSESKKKPAEENEKGRKPPQLSPKTASADVVLSDDDAPSSSARLASSPFTTDNPFATENPFSRSPFTSSTNDIKSKNPEDERATDSNTTAQVGAGDDNASAAAVPDVPSHPFVFGSGISSTSSTGGGTFQIGRGTTSFRGRRGARRIVRARRPPGMAAAASAGASASLENSGADENQPNKRNRYDLETEDSNALCNSSEENRNDSENASNDNESDFSPEDESEEDSEDEEDSEEEDDDDSFDCDCPICSAHRACIMHEDSEEEEEDDESDDEESEQCCVCFRSLSARNPPVALPCCGSKVKSTSTTQFCKPCIVKCIKSQNSDELFGLDGQSVGECPRCRSLLAIHLPVFTSLSNLRLRRARFDLAVRHAAWRPPMRPLLHTAAYVYPYFIPIELLEDDSELAHKLCRWGILEQIQDGQVYAIDPFKQQELKSIIEDMIERNDDDLSPYATVIAKLFESGLRTLCKFKVRLSLRLFNQGIATILMWCGALPKECILKAWKGVLVACLNVFIIAMAVRVIFELAGYALAGFSAVISIGELVSVDSKSGWKRLTDCITDILYTAFALIWFFNRHWIYLLYSVFIFGSRLIITLLLRGKAEWVRAVCLNVGPLSIVYFTHKYYMSWGNDGEMEAVVKQQCVDAFA